jgi:pilus assembly protein CpaF
MDHALVRRLQADTAEQIEARRRADLRVGRSPLEGEDERQYGRNVIGDGIARHVSAMLAAGLQPLGVEEEQALADAVYARLFGAGRLQELLDNAEIENIDINGCDEVFVTYLDGSRERAAPVAENDEELVELLQLLGGYSGMNPRPFDAANPMLDMRLPDGSRLSAVMRASTRPVASVRRHRFSKVFLEDLVGNGTLLPELAEFVAALVRARKNIMVAGATDAGKTTLLRALINMVPAEERICTIENSLELGLRTHQELHHDVVEFEAVQPNSEGVGAVTMAELVRRTLRMNPDRVIVGEVLGPEVVTMLNAMSQGNDGSLSTIHARTPRAVFDRIATYAKQAEERLDRETTHMLIAGALDFVVFIEKAADRGQHGGVRRYVSGVLEVTGFDGAVLATDVFVPGFDGRAVPNPTVGVSCLDDLLAVGYSPVEYSDGWGVG